MNFAAVISLLPLIFFSLPSVEQAANGQNASSVPAALSGIYLTSNTVSSQNGARLLDAFATHGGNMIVFDVQDSTGRLAYPSQIPLSQELNNYKKQIPDLAAAVADLHNRGFYAVARFVLFKNPFLAEAKPAWTLRNRSSGGTFVSRDGPVWLDPSNPQLGNYLRAITLELALSGVDEVQFDYVRFPEAGKGGRIAYSYKDEHRFSRDEVMTHFMRSVKKMLSYLGTKVSVDVFGIVVWDDISWRIIGQNIPEISKVVDAIYPMPYPSHFGPGWGGHENPGDEPYFFVQETSKRFLEQMAGSKAQLRPWLQAFRLRVTNYGPKYITEQIRALNDIGIQQFAAWNASNSYEVTFNALGALKNK